MDSKRFLDADFQDLDIKVRVTGCVLRKNILNFKPVTRKSQHATIYFICDNLCPNLFKEEV
ncbi:MAG: hypothetical protein AMJ42_06455 [Deltaproteobacteria bacterium DG_8]|nr:MAG: hypothetical protein AMJ42_06455 [Deltaproteobacteria bacterium DG_8]